MKLLQTDSSLVGSLSYGILTALLLGLAMPGHVGWWPLLFVALVPILHSSLYLSPWRSGCVGFLSGLLYHLALLYWIIIVLGRYGGLPLWLSVPALLLLACYMSCFSALFCFLLSLVAGRYWHRERSVVALVWAAPVLWVGLDYLRSVLFSGFPWMDLGYGLYTQPRLIQAADIGGHFVVTFTLVLCNGLIVGLIDRQRGDVRWNIRMERRLLLLACSFLVFIGGYSKVRYDIMQGRMARGLQTNVAVVQGNIDQGEKWSPQKKKSTVETYVTLSKSAVKGHTIELVVWPETAVPFYLQQDPLTANILDFTGKENAWLLTGSPSYSAEQQTDVDDLKVEYFNSAFLLAPSGRLQGRYAKQHLVPFGEYVPLRRFLPFLEPLVESVGDFTAGSSSAPLEMGQMKLGVLICFESIFPQIARDSVVAGANLLVNLTNDAWYGRSSAPYQSMAMAVFRAVENKRTLIRAANTGISGFVDPVGNILAQTDIFEADAVTAQLPMLHRVTVFSKSGYLFGAACLSLMLPMLLFRRR